MNSAAEEGQGLALPHAPTVVQRCVEVKFCPGRKPQRNCRCCQRAPARSTLRNCQRRVISETIQAVRPASQTSKNVQAET